MINNDDLNLLIEKYSEDAVLYVKDCKNELDNLILLEFKNGDFVEVNSDEYFRTRKNAAIMAGVGEGFFKTELEFDEIYNLV